MAESRTVQLQFTYKRFEEEPWSIQKSPTFLSLTRLSKAMPAPTGGTYLLQFGLDFSNANLPNPGRSYLTSHGEGKQLTIEHITNDHSQEVS